MGDNPWVLQEQVLVELSEVIKNSLSENSQTRNAALNVRFFFSKIKSFFLVVEDASFYFTCVTTCEEEIKWHN